MKKNDKGEVKGLIEKFKKGKVNSKEIIKVLDERKLSEKEISRGGCACYLIWIVPCFLPAIAKYTNWNFLSFLTKLYVIEFPDVLIYIALGFFIVAVFLAALTSYYNRKMGGCSSEDYTIIFLKRGPYRLLRHPLHFSWSIFFITIPIIINKWIPFTFLSVIGIVAIVALHYYTSVKEEKYLNIMKWGDGYRQYIREVPRWNIIKGLWNLRRR